MHPMFVKLFLEADEDDSPAGERQKRRPATLVRRHPPRTSPKATARVKDHQSRR
jgi:hypothetical protein